MGINRKIAFPFQHSLLVRRWSKVVWDAADPVTAASSVELLHRNSSCSLPRAWFFQAQHLVLNFKHLLESALVQPNVLSYFLP